jgi:hypothetical protein
MKRRVRYLFLFLLLEVSFLASCRPINIFSPLVDPSKMNNDAKVDAGYNAIADGDYAKAIEYFSDVIKSSSGEQLIDAYIGRATAYMNQGAPGLSDAVADMISGDLQFDSPGDVIENVMSGNDYDEFFDNIGNAADDYNGAIANSGPGMDRGILVEAYQANMMAATGVGALTIAYSYNASSPWDDMTESGINTEINAIVSADPTHPKHIDTWGVSAGTNGLADHVRATQEGSEMLLYLQGAFDALMALEPDPPLEMNIPDLKTNINAWAEYGLGIIGGLH